MYHYIDSGLDNVYLANGFQSHETPYGQGVSIENLDGLHSAIGRQIISMEPVLSGKEFRFLRVELNMSQKSFGLLVGMEDQTVANWEKGDKVPKYADIIIRKLYQEKVIHENEKISDLIDQIAKIDEHEAQQEIIFEETKNVWRVKIAA